MRLKQDEQRLEAYIMSDTTLGPAYRIHTERLVLRCWQPADAHLLKAAIDESIEHLSPWMPWIAEEPTELTAKVELIRKCRGKFDHDLEPVRKGLPNQPGRHFTGRGLQRYRRENSVKA